jgi:isoleucyl-tRNA synthetase
MNEYELAKASRLFFDFIEDFSNWYIRRSRKRFQNPQTEKEFFEAQSTLHYVLYETSKIMAPFMPFITEKIYQQIKLDGDLESVHLCDYPKCDNSLIDEELEKEMEEVRNIISIALDKRKDAGIKVRQPLSKLILKKQINEVLFDIIKEELNVKEIIIDSNVDEGVELDFTLTDKLKQEGVAREVIRNIQQMRKNLRYSKNDRILLKLEGDNLSSKLKDFILEEVLAEGYVSEGEFNDIKELNIYDNKILISIQKA